MVEARLILAVVAISGISTASAQDVGFRCSAADPQICPAASAALELQPRMSLHHGSAAEFVMVDTKARKDVATAHPDVTLVQWIPYELGTGVPKAFFEVETDPFDGINEFPNFCKRCGCCDEKPLEELDIGTLERLNSELNQLMWDMRTDQFDGTASHKFLQLGK